MKSLICLLLLTTTCLAQERVILIRDNAFSADTILAPVNSLLNQGWVVKHQSAADGVFLFTLIPPPPKAAEQVSEEKRLARERKNAAYQAQKAARESQPLER